LVLSSAVAGALSFATLLVAEEGALAHLAANATWGLVVGAVVLALLASDGARERPIKAMMAVGVGLAAVRALVTLAGFA
jgi:hypothetical protein